MAQIMLQDAFDQAGLDVTVTSTGVSDEEAGNRIDYRAARTLTRHGYEGGDQHHAAQVTEQHLADADLVLPMTAYHARAVRQLARANATTGAKGGGATPEITGAAPEIIMIRAFDPAAPRITDESNEYLLDHDDPWYGGQQQFEDCFAQLQAAIPGVVAFVRNQLGS